MDDKWRKSSYSGSNGDCVEWRVSGYSKANGNCVQVRVLGDVELRDSKDKDGPVLRFAGSTWGKFVAEVKAGR